MKLIDNWKDSYKLLTVKLGAILSAFFTLLILFSEQLVYLWELIPQQLKDMIPDHAAAWVGGIVAIAMTLARLKKQPELHEVNQFVTVTAGHSNKDPGAVSGKFKEADLAAKFRNAVAFYLREAGIQYKTDGVGALNQDLNAAIKLIKGSSVAVEFHMNAASNKSAHGVETIALPKDKKLAQDLSKAVADALGSRLRGDNGWIDQSQSARGKLGFVSNGGLIVELGFISNEDELAQFNARYWSAAKAVAMVLIKHEKAL